MNDEWLAVAKSYLRYNEFNKSNDDHNVGNKFKDEFDINDDQIEWDTVRFAYKSVYGLPKSLQCSESVYHQFNECEKSSQDVWKVTIGDYVSIKNHTNNYI